MREFPPAPTYILCPPDELLYARIGQARLREELAAYRDRVVHEMSVAALCNAWSNAESTEARLRRENAALKAKLAAARAVLRA